MGRHGLDPVARQHSLWRGERLAAACHAPAGLDHDSYACRTGKGIHAAVERLQGFIRQVTATRRREFRGPLLGSAVALHGQNMAAIARRA